MTFQYHAWVKDPFKGHDRSVDFNVITLKEAITCQILVQCKGEYLQLFEKAIKLLFSF